MNRPTPGTVEERSAPQAPAPALDGRRLHGLIPYGKPSKDLGGFTEVIERGALAGADLSDLIATREHDRAHLLGRHPTTLTTEDRADGFAWSVELPQSPVGEDVRVAIERGDLRSTSWRMVVAEDDWRGDVRHIKRIAKLADVTVTAAPAYGDAAPAEYRSTPNPDPAPPARDNHEPEEGHMKTEDRQEVAMGGLVIEDRQAEAPSVEDRVLDAIRSVAKGESRSLATTTAAAITPPEVSSFLFDRLRPQSVLLRSGVRVIATDRDQLQLPQLSADMTPGFFNELQAITPSDPTFVSLTATPRKLAALVQLSNKIVDDSDPSVVDILNTHIATILGPRLGAQLKASDRPGTHATYTVLVPPPELDCTEGPAIWGLRRCGGGAVRPLPRPPSARSPGRARA